MHVISALALTLTSAALAALQQPGYDDTPKLPGSEWRVHDSARPRPAIVNPGRGGSPPSDALVLFDGSDLDQWRAGDGSEAGWKLVDGAMEVNGTGDIMTARRFEDVQLHLEWRSPSVVESESQGRGNSGLFLMGRYELQVLDSYDNASYADGQAAALYGQRPPDVNASRGPGDWQSFDVFFKAPRFDGEALVSPAVVTVLHNGVLVHHAAEFLGATTHRAVASYSAHGPAPLKLQDHGNPVRYRNVWIREI